MSENSSEYLKRTCLICGCHTNQTINIYEPRSGPNIVQLIQAKFKFQPLNEDKYLCFSCNNWLINWHSLQALNSNDAESPSGTFRAHLNRGNVMQEEKSSGSKKPIAVCRPVAHVKPRLLSDLGDAQANAEASQELNESSKIVSKINFGKRNFRLQLAKRNGIKMQHKSMQQCLCGKYVVVRTNHKLCAKSPTQTTVKCRKCRDLARLKASYLRSITQVEKELAQGGEPLLSGHSSMQNRNLVIETETEIASDTTHDGQSVKEEEKQQQQRQQSETPLQRMRHQYLPKPTVDGKVVSMLRRLGTTLSREPQENGRENTKDNSSLPQIMSPPKPKSKWLRPLDDDEILLNFDSSISEVLPSVQDQFTHVNTLAARKCRLAFQMSETAEIIDLCDDDTDIDYDQEGDDDDDADVSESEEVQERTEIDALEENNFAKAFNLPKGLTITFN